MKIINFFLISILTFCLINCSGEEMKSDKLHGGVPLAEKIPHAKIINGNEIVDDYDWLRDENWPDVKNKKILNYLGEENQYSDYFFNPKKEFVTNLFDELKGRVKLSDQTVPIKKDNYYYYTRTESDKNYPIYARRENSMDSPEEILLDVNLLAEGKSFFKIGAFSISPDNKKIAYSVDETGAEKYTIKIINIDNKTHFLDEIPNVIGNVQWHENVNGFLYTPVNDKWRVKEIKFHILGDDSVNDRLILSEDDDLYRLSFSKTSSKEYFILRSRGYDSEKIWIVPMFDFNLNFQLLLDRKENIFYDIDHGNKYFYIRTNDNGPNYRLIKIQDNDLTSSNIEEVFAHNTGKYLDSFDLTKNYLITNYRNLGLPEIEIYDLNSDDMREVDFPDKSFIANAYSTNYSEDDIRIDYSSPKNPETVYYYNFGNDTKNIAKISEVPSGFDPEEYEVERKLARNEDGVMIPMTVLYKKSLFKNDGSNPLYITGYGAYGISIPPLFRRSSISLVDRGFVFAVAHIRGGDDLGQEWYEGAKFLNKKNTFEDFISCIEHLEESKYTSKGKITISGGSAGGMLVGYVANNIPEYLNSVVAHVPFVDVLNTMLDSSLPLTPGEFKEWGNPSEQEYFDYIKSYSPYENVKSQKYPNMFITAGLYDPRVTYWEAAKWTAKLRDHNVGNNLILLKTNMDAGHQGSSGRFDHLKEVAEEFVFVLTMNAIDK